MNHKLSAAFLSAAMVALGAGSSYGRATPGSFEFEEPFSDTVMNYPCSGGDPVTMTGTSIQKGHFTLIDPRHFRVQGSNTSEYRADFPDGRYALGNETDHFSFGFGADLAAGTDTSAQQENATLYAADGQAIARSPSV